MSSNSALTESPTPDSATTSQAQTCNEPNRENSRSERLGIAAGGLAENAFQNTLLMLANPIFNIGMHVSPVLVGIAMAIPRFWEMILDPWIGVASDRTRSRWGRRIPWIVISCFACIITFAAIWWVPQSWSVTHKGYWLIFFSFLFYTAYSFFAVPYAALTIDETSEGTDRTSVMTTRVAFANLAGLMMSWLYWLCLRDTFDSPVEGIRWVGPIFGLVVGITALLPAWIVLRKRNANRRRIAMPDGNENTKPAVQTSLSLPEKKAKAGSFKPILKIPAMRCVIAAMMSILLGFTLVGHLGFYILAYYACEGDLKQAGLVTGVSATVSAIVSIAICPLVATIAKRIGKRTTLLTLLGLGVVASLSQWWLLTPANPYLSIISGVGNAIGLVGFLSLMPTFLGDISDNYFARTGQACQGMLVAVYGVAVKLGASLALMATGYVLVICGFEAGMALETMDEPIVRMRIFSALIPALAGIGAMIAMSRFHLPPLGTKTAN